MDNDIRVVTDKEVYLLASAAVSKSETEIVFRNWLRTGGLTGADITDAITIVGVDDLSLPMSVTSVESWGKWSLIQGSFQKREFDRDQRQYERDYLAYQAEEKKQHAAKEGGQSYALPPMPRSPDREDYYEYFPDHGEYTTSFKGILRAFGEEALGRAKPYLNDIAISLDQLLRKGFPAAEAAATAPAAINRDVLNTLVDEYVSDRGIDWVKDQAKKYEKAKKLEIGDVNYRRECNIVFLPVRVIEYSYAGRTYVAISDPIRNEYLLGTPPAPVKAVPPAAVAGKSNMKLAGMAAGAVALLAVLGGGYFMLSSKHKEAATVQAPTPAAPDNAAQQQAQQKAAQQAAQKQAAAQAAQQQAAAQAAQQQAAAQAAQLAAQQQAQQAAAANAAATEAAAQAAAQQAAEQAAQLAVQQATQRAAAERAAKAAAKQAAAAAAAEQAAQAQAQAAAQAAATEQAQAAAQVQAAAQLAATSKPTQNAKATANAANSLTADADASSGAPPAKVDAESGKKQAASKTVASPEPKHPPAVGLTGKFYEAFSSGNLRLAATATPTAGGAAILSTEAETHDGQGLAKTTAQASSGNDLGYYYLGVAAQDAGNGAAARTYYQLSLQHSQTNNPPSVCSPRHKETYQPDLCHGIVLPSRAARALASLPGD
jgi:hypothetical protein